MVSLNSKLLLAFILSFPIVLFSVFAINDSLNNLNETNLTVENMSSNETDGSSVPESYYLEIGSDDGLNLDFSEAIPKFEDFGDSIIWYQTLLVENTLDSMFSGSVDLLSNNYAKSLLDADAKVAIYEDGGILSDTFAFNTEIEPNSEKEFEIEYYTNPIYYDLICSEKGVTDIIPSDAIIIDSDVDLNLIENYSFKVCNLSLDYDSSLDYSNLKIPVADIVTFNVSKIYSVKDDYFLDQNDFIEVD